MIFWRPENRNRNAHSGLQRIKGRWFHICPCFFSNLNIYNGTGAFYDIILGNMSETPWNRWNQIAGAVSLHSASNFIDINVSRNWLWVFPEITICDAVFLIFLTMCFLNLISEYYNWYVKCHDASIDVRLIILWYDWQYFKNPELSHTIFIHCISCFWWWCVRRMSNTALTE